MTTTLAQSWTTANHRYLTAAVRALHHELALHQARTAADAEQILSQQALLSAAQQAAEDVSAELPSPSALATLTTLLSLSDFECKVLLLCAAVELDSAFGALVASLQGGAPLPTFSLALAAFPHAHWSALLPTAPLRYWQLVKPAAGPLLTQSPLKIDEQILHYLTGTCTLDERLRDLAEPVRPEDLLTDSQKVLADGMARACAGEMLPVLVLRGDDAAGNAALGSHASALLGLQLYSLPAHLIPAAVPEANQLLRIWNREAALLSYALHVDCADLDPGDRARTQGAAHFIDHVDGVLLLSGGPWEPRLKRPKAEFTVPKPTPAEQLQLWQNALGPAAHPLEALQALVAQFDLSASSIQAASADALRAATAETPAGKAAATPLARRLWQACCANTRPRVDELAQRIEPGATWADLVLPDAQLHTLREIAWQVRQRHRVYHEWGFGGSGARGLGITVLFAGESGTGKTMAAEVLAHALHLDLYRIDLSQVVNKYIGETEKNLRRIFDAAEAGGAILLFDEADALFGKRSEVKDSHDRHSNIEVSYLLQRMEAYRGLAVLTTNLRAALDKAFLRRLRFVVQFPYPDAAQRAEIWRRVFPAATPRENLDFEKLARLSVPGGNIRNMALNAAFAAAHDNQPVRMAHIARAARSEYNKLERPLSHAEMNGW